MIVHLGLFDNSISYYLHGWILSEFVRTKIVDLKANLSHCLSKFVHLFSAIRVSVKDKREEFELLNKPIEIREYLDLLTLVQNEKLATT